jgi:hypothetical protein
MVVNTQSGRCVRENIGLQHVDLEEDPYSLVAVCERSGNRIIIDAYTSWLLVECGHDRLPSLSQTPPPPPMRACACVCSHTHLIEIIRRGRRTLVFVARRGGVCGHWRHARVQLRRVAIVRRLWGPVSRQRIKSERIGQGMRGGESEQTKIDNIHRVLERATDQIVAVYSRPESYFLKTVTMISAMIGCNDVDCPSL